MFPEDRTERAKQNRVLAMHAHGSLAEAWDPSFARLWRVDPCGTYAELDAMGMANGTDAIWTALTWLGRQREPDLIRNYALALCADMPATARECVDRLQLIETRRIMAAARRMLAAEARP